MATDSRKPHFSYLHRKINRYQILFHWKNLFNDEFRLVNIGAYCADDAVEYFQGYYFAHLAEIEIKGLYKLQPDGRYNLLTSYKI